MCFYNMHIISSLDKNEFLIFGLIIDYSCKVRKEND